MRFKVGYKWNMLPKNCISFMIFCGRKNKSFHTAEFRFFIFWDNICFIFQTWSDESFKWTIGVQFGTNDEIIFMHVLLYLKFKGGSQPIVSTVNFHLNQILWLSSERRKLQPNLNYFLLLSKFLSNSRFFYGAFPRILY